MFGKYLHLFLLWNKQWHLLLVLLAQRRFCLEQYIPKQYRSQWAEGQTPLVFSHGEGNSQRTLACQQSSFNLLCLLHYQDFPIGISFIIRKEELVHGRREKQIKNTRHKKPNKAGAVSNEVRQDQAWREYKFPQEALESMGKDTEMEIYFNGIVKEMLKDLGFVPVFLEKGSMVKDIGEMTP